MEAFELDLAAPIWAFDARQGAMVLLAGTVAALVTFNLAFFRHLMRAYASPRRTSRRKWPLARLGKR
jgi:hypothetical protein